MKNDFQSCQGLVRMGWGPKWECHNPSRFWNRDNIWYRSSTKIVPNTLSNFELKKYSCAVLQIHEKWFSFLWWTCSNGWGPKWECHNPSKFWNRENIWYRSSTKKVLSTLSNFELKKYSCAVSWKEKFSLVKDLFKWVEVLSRSVIILVGSETEIIFDKGHLRKKYLTRCQISSSKNTLVQFHEKWFSVLSRTCSNGLRS